MNNKKEYSWEDKRNQFGYCVIFKLEGVCPEIVHKRDDFRERL